MNYFDKMVDFAMTDYTTLAEKELRRQIKSVMMEVERDCRHKAAEMSHTLANDIHNMRHDT